VCKRQQGERNTLAKSACLDRLSHGCTSRPHTEQMSSLYARATTARPRPSRPARHLGSISTRKILPPEACDRPALCASVRRHGLGAARSCSLPLRFLGDYHHHQGLLSQWTGSDSDFTPFLPFRQLPDGSHSGKRVSTTCLLAACGLQQNTHELRPASRRRLVTVG
jgi:hypothetical protein